MDLLITFSFKRSHFVKQLVCYYPQRPNINPRVVGQFTVKVRLINVFVGTLPNNLRRHILISATKELQSLLWVYITRHTEIS